MWVDLSGFEVCITVLFQTGAVHQDVKRRREKLGSPNDVEAKDLENFTMGLISLDDKGRVLQTPEFLDLWKKAGQVSGFLFVLAGL